MLPPSLTLKGIWVAIVAGVFAFLILLNVFQAFNTYANIRIGLPFGMHIGYEGWKPKALRFEREYAQYRKDVKRASEENAEAQRQLIQQQKDQFNQSAEIQNAEYEKQIALARGALDRYKLANRLWPGDGGFSPAPAAGQVDGPGVSEGPAPATELFAISGTDLDTCAVDYTYGKQAHDWVKDLIERGAAEFAD